MSDSNYESAVRAHNANLQRVLEGFKVVISTASNALRLLATFNAGGIIALLGFLGAIAGKEKPVFLNAGVFLCPMSAFAIGLIAGTIGATTMYFAQYFYFEEVKAVKFDHVYPFEHPTPASKRCRTTAICFHGLTLFLAAVALTAFIVGMFLSISLIQTAKLS